VNPEAVPASSREALRRRITEVAARLEAGAGDGAARELRAALEEWTAGERAWAEELSRRLGVHHGINNALVGVRGNVQLLLLNPAAQAPGVKDRLEVVLRESDRIKEAALRLRELKTELAALAGTPDDASTRAA
jgi:nitrogen-specific signal transduction histidine kinase